MEVEKPGLGAGRLQLNAGESQLFRFLLDFVRAKQLSVTLRVAGGWVRDKLMRTESHDIDIALDTMMGEQFVLQLQEHMREQGMQMRGHGVIKVNPAQSKHLETSTCKLFERDIDFVNLRGEEYAEDSRIPTVKFGTPREDALRRDLTINSLFYNLTEDTLEDLTERGLQDLEDRLIRTPLEPVRTFLDDPLRILRCFRFATRFDFRMDPAILEAVRLPEVRKSFRDKISKERIFNELEKILTGPNVPAGLALLSESNMWPYIFELPETTADLATLHERSQQHVQALSALLQAKQIDLSVAEQ